MRNLVFKNCAALVIIYLVACDNQPDNGWIEVISEPDRANVFLDDNPTGKTTDCVLDDVSPEEHTVKLVSEGYHDWSTIVEVKAGDTAKVNALLTPDTLPDDTFPKDTVLWRFEIDLIGHSHKTPMLFQDGSISVCSGKYLYAVNPDGSLKWRYAPDYWVEALAIGQDDYTYCNSQFLGTQCFMSLYPTGGTFWWAISATTASSCVVTENGDIYYLRGDSIKAIEPDANPKWEYDMDSTQTTNQAAGLVIGYDGTIYTTINKNTTPFLVALNPDGSLKWESEIGGAFFSLAVGTDGTVYSVSGSLYATDINGVLKWVYGDGSFNGYYSSSPIIGLDGTVYFFDCGGSEKGSLYAVSQSGEFKWRYEDIVGLRLMPLVASDGTIYIGSWDTYLYAINSDGSLKWKYEIGDTIWSSLAMSNDGVLYFCAGDYLYAFATSSEGLADSPWPKFQHDNQNTGRAGP